MAVYVLRRLASAVLLLWVLLSATFLLIHLAPGNPVDLILGEQRVSAEFRASEIARLGLDRSIGEQYIRWLGAMVRLDWGTALDGRPALGKLLTALPATVLLAIGVVVVRYGLGIVLGVISAIRHDRWQDHVIRITTLVLFALPTFFLGYLAIEWLSVRAGWVPTSGMRSDQPPAALVARGLDILRHLLLPALVVGLSSCGRIVRLVRGGLLDVLQQDYIRFARARGLSRQRVLWRHALPNAIGPVVQHLGVSLPQLLSGMLIVEIVFAWPGIGKVAFDAVGARDYAVILASTAIAGLLVVLGSLATDLAHAALDPRVRDAQA